MEDNLLIVENRPPVCTISFNRPEKKNALSPELLARFTEVMKASADDSSIRVIVVRGAGNEMFSSGFDLSIVPVPTGRPAPSGKAGGQNPLQGAIGTILSHRCPVIAMINGAAVGGACDLASACDIRLASDKARFAIPPTKLGIMYYPDGIRRLVELVGVAGAKEILFTADFIDAARARDLGLVNQVFPAANLQAATYDMAERIAKNAPLSISGLKAMVSKVSRTWPLNEQDLAECRALMERCLGSADRQEGMQAFREKRAPVFKGR